MTLLDFDTHFCNSHHTFDLLSIRCSPVDRWHWVALFDHQRSKSNRTLSLTFRTANEHVSVLPLRQVVKRMSTFLSSGTDHSEAAESIPYFKWGTVVHFRVSSERLKKQLFLRVSTDCLNEMGDFDKVYVSTCCQRAAHQFFNQLFALSLAYQEAKWFAGAFRMLRHRLPKLVIDLILCYRGIDTTSLCTALLLRFLPTPSTFDFKTLYCKARTFFDVPLYFSRDAFDLCTCDWEFTCIKCRRGHVRVRFSVPRALIDIVFCNGGSGPVLKWHYIIETAYGSGVNISFEIDAVPLMQPFAIAESRCRHAPDAHQPFTSVQVSFDNRTLRFQHDDVYWLNLDKSMYYFIPLLPDANDCAKRWSYFQGQCDQTVTLSSVTVHFENQCHPVVPIQLFLASKNEF